MKLKCPSCGEREMEMMSKSQIAFNSFVNPAVFAIVLNLVKDWIVPSKYVCRNCGHMQDA